MGLVADMLDLCLLGLSAENAKTTLKQKRKREMTCWLAENAAKAYLRSLNMVSNVT